MSLLGAVGLLLSVCEQGAVARSPCRAQLLGQGVSSSSSHGRARCSSRGLCTNPSRMASDRGWRGTRPSWTLLGHLLAVSALKVPLLRKGPVADGHGHVALVAQGIHHLQALPHRDLVQPVVFLEQTETDGIYLLKPLFSIVKLELEVMPKGRGAPCDRWGFQQPPCHSRPTAVVQCSTPHSHTQTRKQRLSRPHRPPAGILFIAQSFNELEGWSNPLPSTQQRESPQGCSGHRQVTES